MRATACSEADRISDEPVGLPDYGVRVLACTVRKRPFPTEAIFQAAEAAGVHDARNTMVMLIRAGLPWPPAVLDELAKAGHVQQYAQSARLEMYRIPFDQRARGQALAKDGWTCDALQLSPDYDTVPSHWWPLGGFAL